jgi:hypothetical protein
MKSIEEKALVAALDDEETNAAELIAQLLPGERARLAKAARRLAELCEAKGTGYRRESYMVGVAVMLVLYTVVMIWLYMRGA